MGLHKAHLSGLRCDKWLSYEYLENVTGILIGTRCFSEQNLLFTEMKTLLLKYYSVSILLLVN